MVAFFSKELISVLVPCILLVSILQILVSKKDLSLKENLKLIKSQLVSDIDLSDSTNLSSTVSITVKRKKYLLMKEKVRNHADFILHIGNILGILLIVTMLFFLADLPATTKTLMSGKLIFFVFAIRSIVATGKEISVSLNQILVLRKDNETLMRILSHNKDNFKTIT